MNDLNHSPPTEGAGFSIDISSDRRADIEIKHGKIAAFLRDSNRDSLLLLEPENFAWITAGATSRGQLDTDSMPAIFCTPEGRWLISSNTDTQRLFEEELDGLGFQLKEWPWYRGRAQLLADLSLPRKMAFDHPAPEGFAGDVVNVSETLTSWRQTLSPYEVASLIALGEGLAHALEAACRTLRQGDTEREVAGQLAHRLMHRGLQPINVSVAGDGRSRGYRRFGYTSTPIDRFVVVTATARKYGLCASSSRTVCFGEMPEDLRNEQNAVVRVSAAYLASTWADALPREILLGGRRIYLLSGYEHEWQHAPQGWLSGRRPIEKLFTPTMPDLLEEGMVVTWNASAGAAVSCDTFLVTANGPKAITPPEAWPMKRIKIQGAECTRPDVLIR